MRIENGPAISNSAPRRKLAASVICIASCSLRKNVVTGPPHSRNAAGAIQSEPKSGTIVPRSVFDVVDAYGAHAPSISTRTRGALAIGTNPSETFGPNRCTCVRPIPRKTPAPKYARRTVGGVFSVAVRFAGQRAGSATGGGGHDGHAGQTGQGSGGRGGSKAPRSLAAARADS